MTKLKIMLEKEKQKTLRLEGQFADKLSSLAIRITIGILLVVFGMKL